MSTEDDEFKDVEKGLQAENTAQRSSVTFMLIFMVGGVIITFVISRFAETLGGLMGSGRVMPQILMTGATSLLLGGLQAWVFKSKIRSRVNVFIAVSLLGGVVGG